MKSNELLLRRLKDDIEDYKLLQKWYSEKEIYSQFEQRKLNIDEIIKKYYPRTLENALVPVYIIEYKNIPIGIIQYKLIDEENKELYKIKGTNNYEIDIFIGELKYHSKGIGYKSINLISEYLFKEKQAKTLVMCPLENNISAIKCYQKSGFVFKDKFITEDTIGILNKYILMIKGEM